MSATSIFFLRNQIIFVSLLLNASVYHVPVTENVMSLYVLAVNVLLDEFENNH